MKRFGLGGRVEGIEFFQNQRHFAAVVHGMVVYPVGGEKEEAGDAVFEEQGAGDGGTFGEAIVKGEEGGRFSDSAIRRFSEGEEGGVIKERVMLFEPKEVLFEFGGGFGGVKMFEVGERRIGDGVVKESDRVAREQALVGGKRDVRGKHPRGF